MLFWYRPKLVSESRQTCGVAELTCVLPCGRRSRINSGKRFALQFEVSGDPANAGMMRESLFKVTLEHPVDVAFQADDLFRRNRRMVFFDMDSTLIQVRPHQTQALD